MTFVLKRDLLEAHKIRASQPAMLLVSILSPTSATRRGGMPMRPQCSLACLRNDLSSRTESEPCALIGASWQKQNRPCPQLVSAVYCQDIVYSRYTTTSILISLLLTASSWHWLSLISLFCLTLSRANFRHRAFKLGSLTRTNSCNRTRFRGSIFYSYDNLSMNPRVDQTNACRFPCNPASVPHFPSSSK
jgi:hypothetical protein